MACSSLTARALPARARPLCLARAKGTVVSSNPAVEALLNAFSASRDGRLLISALDLATADADKRAIIAAALQTLDAGIDAVARERLARTALDMGDALDAVELCGEERTLLSIRVDALLVAGRPAEAETVYR